MKLSILLSTAISASLFSLSSAAACTPQTGNTNIPQWFITGILKIGTQLASVVDPETAARAADLAVSVNAHANSMLIENSVKVKRQTSALECKAGETCYSYSSYPWCGSNTAHTVRDESGIAYNLDNGDYTLPDGTKGNVYTNFQPLLSLASLSAAGGTVATTAPTGGASKTTPASSPAVATGGSSSRTGSASASASASASKSAGESGSGGQLEPPKGAAGRVAISGWEVALGAAGVLAAVL